MTTESILELTDKNFEETVSSSEIPVLVDFWAEWCHPCNILTPRVANVADKFKGELTVAKLNVDENPKIASKFNITGIPTLIFFKGGDVQDIIVGAVSEEEIVSAFNKIK